MKFKKPDFVQTVLITALTVICILSMLFALHVISRSFFSTAIGWLYCLMGMEMLIAIIKKNSVYHDRFELRVLGMIYFLVMFNSRLFILGVPLSDSRILLVTAVLNISSLAMILTARHYISKPTETE